MPTPSDEELMLNVRDGDLAAFEQLVPRRQTEAWRVAYRFTGDAAEAEDIAQQAFLRILDAAPRYTPTAAFRTYLYQVVTRLCLDRHRKKRPVLAESLPDPAAAAPTPEEHAGARDRDRLIQTALDSLPADHRLAIVLRYFEGLSGVEMAAAMGRSPKAVERLLARARAALAPRLELLREK
ncbi:MAG: hypothetical protein A3K19_29305 [Lentisphaerae bacterium RIFOXYB12_FULL_65_16]|nr:MAG: hypothetical protein A3K18_13340 [Lentisphaerae bacterium RIFOXYA12_64_32]OGV88425.1 MAG: hypothetical protein A3K19_29305 [Lentisphaerae bacterium RIFOXYB12_FULL_65_16]